jgi:hypothetical protein
MKPVPASVVASQRRHWRISPGSSLVSARTMIDIGQIMRKPSWGPPMPCAAVPLKK